MSVQAALADAQKEQMTLIQTIGNLEKQIADLETWETDKQEYEMKSLPSGSIVYSLKPEAQSAKPAHYICATCYDHHKRSILQRKAGSIAQTHLGIPPMYVCSNCKSEIIA
jgi:DNA-directed RNA polymerase subunit RPC12/RpoP